MRQRIGFRYILDESIRELDRKYEPIYNELFPKRFAFYFDIHGLYFKFFQKC